MIRAILAALLIGLATNADAIKLYPALAGDLTNDTIPAANIDAGNLGAGVLSPNWAKVINLNARVTGGAGTNANPYTGWDSIALTSNTAYEMAGPNDGTCYYFSVKSSLNVGFSGIQWLTKGCAYIKWNGATAGTVVKDDCGIPPAGSGACQDQRIENMQIIGSTDTSNKTSTCFLLQSVSRSRFTGMHFINCLIGRDIGFSVDDLFVNNINSTNVDTFAVNTTTGVWIHGYNSAGHVNGDLFLNEQVEGTTGPGFDADLADRVILKGGTSEGNQRGVGISSACMDWTIDSMDFESNTSLEDVVSSGTRISMYGITSSASDSLIFTGQSAYNSVYSGDEGTILNKTGAFGNRFVNINAQTAFTDNSTNSTDINPRVNGQFVGSVFTDTVTAQYFLGVGTATPGVRLDVQENVAQNTYIVRLGTGVTQPSLVSVSTAGQVIIGTQTYQQAQLEVSMGQMAQGIQVNGSASRSYLTPTVLNLAQTYTGSATNTLNMSGGALTIQSNSGDVMINPASVEKVRFAKDGNTSVKGSLTVGNGASVSTITVNSSGINPGASFTPNLSSGTAPSTLSGTFANTSLGPCIASSTQTINLPVAEQVLVNVHCTISVNSLAAVIGSGYLMDGALQDGETATKGIVAPLEAVSTDGTNESFVSILFGVAAGSHSFCYAPFVSAGTGTIDSTNSICRMSVNMLP